ncbi:hypothetical protein [Streptomyces mesophilus]|uniref:hypothetical protein n=1 Tax=Streptomyces mesophilus TaxID=1775132 RepID=UPI00332996BE
MRNAIFQLLLWAVVLCTPLPRGRHRAVACRAMGDRPQSVAAQRLFDGSASPLVRPYLFGSAEDFLERRRQRERRRALYLATLGVDIGPERIHGVALTRGTA